MSPKFIQTTDSKQGQAEVAKFLSARAHDGPTSWFLSGGSNIGIEKSILQSLNPQLRDEIKLILSDERLVPAGDGNSNFTSLKKAGITNPSFQDILILKNEKLIADAYEQQIESVLSSTFTIAQLGIGADGHILGVLPGSEAATSNAVIEVYEGSDFNRITPTLETMKRFDKIFIFCFGANKREALKRLLARAESQEDLPSSALYLCRDVTIYSDQIGGTE
jgi:6-phosphogluconolactonase/glucosamine-6-phosphate isomerase/deaminase